MSFVVGGVCPARPASCMYLPMESVPFTGDYCRVADAKFAKPGTASTVSVAVIMVLAACPRDSRAQIVVPPANGGKPGQVTCRYSIAVPDNAAHGIIADVVLSGSGNRIGSPVARQDTSSVVPAPAPTQGEPGQALPGSCAFISDSPPSSREAVIPLISFRGSKAPSMMASPTPQGLKLCESKSYSYSGTYESAICGSFRVSAAKLFKCMLVYDSDGGDSKGYQGG